MVKVLPEKCLMVGDTIVDILAGKAAGMRTIGFYVVLGHKKNLTKRRQIISCPPRLI